MGSIESEIYSELINPECHCIVCESKDLTSLESINVAQQHHQYAPTNKYRQIQLNEAASKSSLSYQLKRCNHCLLEYTTPLIAPNSDWYDLAYQTLDLYPQARWEYGHTINKMKAGELLYELGCGSGEFLKLCKQKNILALGFDFSPDAVSSCKAKGLDASLFDLTKPTPQIGEKAKYITAFHVLEHLDRPTALFQFARSIADAETTFWVAVPSNTRPTRILLEPDYLDQPPHHMTRWTPESLKYVGAKGGWTLEKVLYEPISYKTSLWWITTRTKLYKFIMLETNQNQFIESFIRILIIPYAILQKTLFYPNMKGFTMLAQYKLMFT